MPKDTQLQRPRFYLGTTVPPDLVIDRTDELQQAKEALIDRECNVLVLGKRKTGKTSFVGKLGRELEREHVLVVRVNMLPFADNPATVLREILLLLCYEIGEHVFKKNAPTLLLSLGEKPPGLDSEYGRFFQIYRLVRFMSASQTKHFSIGAGLNSPAVGKLEISKAKEERIDIDKLEASEFIKLVHELMDICHRAGYSSVVVIVDEANQLAVQVSKEILQTYFEIFRERQILFVFVADSSLADYRPVLELFDTVCTIGPFMSSADVTDLLRLYFLGQLGSDYGDSFNDNSIGHIYALSKGNPYLVQLLCSAALDEALRRGILPVNESDVVTAWAKILGKERQLQAFWD